MTTPLTEAELATLEGLLSRLAEPGAAPGATLPPALFGFMTELVATANVDLLVEDGERGVLLAWRDDANGRGWHVPGSIIRHREALAHRIAACAADEFGCALAVAPGPAALIEIFDDRGHSVSLVFRARLAGEPGRRLVGDWETPAPGDLGWFRTLPAAMYPSHRVYGEVLSALAASGPGHRIGVFSQHVGERDAARRSAAGEIGPGPGPAAG